MDMFVLGGFVVGLLISIPLFFSVTSVRAKVSKMQPENKLAAKFMVQTLEASLLVAGFALSIYGNYLTAKAGEGKMNQPDFTNLANQFSHWFEWYLGLIFGLVGIAVGYGLILMGKSAWQYFRHKHEKSTSNQDTEQDVLVSPKELESTITKIESYKKAKKNLDSCLKDIQEKLKE